MSYSRLRIFHGPHDALAVEDVPARANTVTVPLGDILPTLADAVLDRRAWVQDFLNDEITISTDLYEVLLAYEHYRRPAG
jgi:hypothetical protein